MHRLTAMAQNRAKPRVGPARPPRPGPCVTLSGPRYGPVTRIHRSATPLHPGTTAGRRQWTLQEPDPHRSGRSGNRAVQLRGDGVAPTRHRWKPGPSQRRPGGPGSGASPLGVARPAGPHPEPEPGARTRGPNPADRTPARSSHAPRPPRSRGNAPRTVRSAVPPAAPVQHGPGTRGGPGGSGDRSGDGISCRTREWPF
jgi:hypothetical protein